MIRYTCWISHFKRTQLKVIEWGIFNFFFSKLEISSCIIFYLINFDYLNKKTKKREYKVSPFFKLKLLTHIWINSSRCLLFRKLSWIIIQLSSFFFLILILIQKFLAELSHLERNKTKNFYEFFLFCFNYLFFVCVWIT